MRRAENTRNWICECAFRFSNSLNGWLNSVLIFTIKTHISRELTWMQTLFKFDQLIQLSMKMYEVREKETKHNSSVAPRFEKPADNPRKQFDKYLYYKSNALVILFELIHSLHYFCLVLLSIGWKSWYVRSALIFHSGSNQPLLFAIRVLCTCAHQRIFFPLVSNIS